jgi:hypothetical protein
MHMFVHLSYRDVIIDGIPIFRREFHPLQKTITAFIRFSDRMEAQSATSLLVEHGSINMTVMFQ